jgi:hypothetical protein
MMNTNLDQSNINKLKALLKKRYPQLTETDLQHEEGLENNMLRMVEYKLGKTKEELHKIIAEF